MNNRKDCFPLISFGETMYRKTEDFVTLTLVFLSFWAIWLHFVVSKSFKKCYKQEKYGEIRKFKKKWKKSEQTNKCKKMLVISRISK